MTSIGKAHKFSLRVEEKFNKKFDNKNSGRGRDRRSDGWSYGGQNDDK